MEAPPQGVQESLREDVDALATRYELSDRSTKGLHGLVQLIDWTAPNFVPRSDSAHDARERRRPLAAARHVVSSTIAESLSGLELEPVRTARRIGDIGSGAGFPGLVLAIALPGARVTLIEKVREKCRFLRRASEELGLDKVEVIEGSVQKWSEGVGACDLVTSRKVGRLNTMVEWSAPLLAPEGAVALWPGRSDFDGGADAADTAAEAAEAAGLRLAQVHPVQSMNRKGERLVKHLYLYVKAGES